MKHSSQAVSKRILCVEMLPGSLWALPESPGTTCPEALGRALRGAYEVNALRNELDPWGNATCPRMEWKGKDRCSQKPVNRFLGPGCDPTRGRLPLFRGSSEVGCVLQRVWGPAHTTLQKFSVNSRVCSVFND